MEPEYVTGTSLVTGLCNINLPRASTKAEANLAAAPLALGSLCRFDSCISLSITCYGCIIRSRPAHSCAILQVLFEK